MTQPKLTPIAVAVYAATLAPDQLPHVVTTQAMCNEIRARFGGSWWIGAEFYIFNTPFGDVAVHA